MSSTDHSAPQYVVFSTHPSPRPTYAKISSLAPYSRTSSAYDPPSLRDQVLHPYNTTGKNIDSYKIHKYTKSAECKTCRYTKETQGFKEFMFILILLSCSPVGAPSFLVLSGFAVIQYKFPKYRMYTKYSCHLILLSSIFQMIFLKICTFVPLFLNMSVLSRNHPCTPPPRPPDAVRLPCIPFSLRIPGYSLLDPSFHLYIFISKHFYPFLWDSLSFIFWSPIYVKWRHIKNK